MNKKKLQTFDSICFHSKSHFEEDGTQNHLIFQPAQRCFIKISNTDHVFEWKSKSLSDESTKAPATSNNILDPSLNYVGSKIRAEFKGSCLKEDKSSI